MGLIKSMREWIKWEARLYWPAFPRRRSWLVFIFCLAVCGYSLLTLLGMFVEFDLETFVLSILGILASGSAAVRQWRIL